LPTAPEQSITSRGSKSSSIYANTAQQYQVYGLTQKDSRTVAISTAKQPAEPIDSPF